MDAVRNAFSCIQATLYKDILRYREPWLYDKETLDIVREYNLLRYRLRPYLYAGAYIAYQSGVGMFCPLALEYPSDRRAVRYDEYLLGKNLLIAPVSASCDSGSKGESDAPFKHVAERDGQEIYLPAGKWMDAFDGTIYSGKQTLKKRYPLHAMPLFIRLGALLPLAEHALNTKQQSFKKLIYDFYPEKTSADHGYRYEDDGETTHTRRGHFPKAIIPQTIRLRRMLSSCIFSPPRDALKAKDL